MAGRNVQNGPAVVEQSGSRLCHQTTRVERQGPSLTTNTACRFWPLPPKRTPSATRRPAECLRPPTHTLARTPELPRPLHERPVKAQAPPRQAP